MVTLHQFIPRQIRDDAATGDSVVGRVAAWLFVHAPVNRHPIGSHSNPQGDACLRVCRPHDAAIPHPARVF